MKNILLLIKVAVICFLVVLNDFSFATLNEKTAVKRTVNSKQQSKIVKPLVTLFNQEGKISEKEVKLPKKIIKLSNEKLQFPEVKPLLLQTFEKSEFLSYFVGAIALPLSWLLMKFIVGDSLLVSLESVLRNAITGTDGDFEYLAKYLIPHIDHLSYRIFCPIGSSKSSRLFYNLASIFLMVQKIKYFYYFNLSMPYFLAAAVFNQFLLIGLHYFFFLKFKSFNSGTSLDRVLRKDLLTELYYHGILQIMIQLLYGNVFTLFDFRVIPLTIAIMGVQFIAHFAALRAVNKGIVFKNLFAPEYDKFIAKTKKDNKIKLLIEKLIEEEEKKEREKKRERNEIEKNEIEKNERERNEVERNEVERNEVERNEVERNEIEKNERERNEIERNEIERNERERNEIERNEREKKEEEKNEKTKLDNEEINKAPTVKQTEEKKIHNNLR